MPLLEESTVIQNLKVQRKGTENVAIKNTFMYRISTLIALKTIAHLFKSNGACIPISKNLIVKTRSYVHLAEAATMRFVAENTSLPVPQVFAPPSPRTALSVKICVAGTVREASVPRPCPRMGPFNTIQEFHLFLKENLRPEEVKVDKEDDEDWQGIFEMAARQDGPWPPPVVFTNGDLNPFNILVCGDEVAAIIDWEYAGWFPNYWEYTTAWCGSLARTKWQDNLRKFPDAFSVELEMEKVRNK